MNDRIRAKPPKTETERWTEGVVVDIDKKEHVTVTLDTGSEQVEVTVTNAVFDLFTGRLEEQPIGATAYFIKKSG